MLLVPLQLMIGPVRIRHLLRSADQPAARRIIVAVWEIIFHTRIHQPARISAVVLGVALPVLAIRQLVLVAEIPNIVQLELV
jgi:hypothetical protein